MLKKQISSKRVSLIFGILVICFLVVFYIFAWTEPIVSPPGGNVAAPLNTSGTGQTKTGWLAFPVFYDSTDYPSYFIDPQGAVGGASVKVKGYIQAEGGYKSSIGGVVYTGLTKTINVVYYQSGYGTCTLTFKNGLLTATTCPEP